MPSVSRKKLAEKLIDAGEKLSSPPSSIDELLELLDDSMGQAVSYILKYVCEAEDEERSNEQNLQTCLFKSNSCSKSKTTSDHISRLVSPTRLLSCIDSSTANNNNVVKHRFKVTDLNTQVVEDKSQVHLPKKRRKGKGEKARKEATVVIEREIKHYISSQKILLVGEGDFSFFACLVRSFGYASNIVATSLDSTGNQPLTISI